MTTLDEAVAKAMTELRQTPINAIHRQTAVKWAGRAIAAFRLFLETGAVHFICDGEDFMHEALEPCLSGIVTTACCYGAISRSYRTVFYARSIGAQLDA